MDTNITVLSDGADILKTEKNEFVYRILSGSALVYIAPEYSGGSTGRRMFVCEVPENTFVPGLDYTDYDGVRWNLYISSSGICETGISYECTDSEAVQKDFAKLIKLSNYEFEGFEEGMVEWYRLNLLKEEGFIHLTGRDRKKVRESSLNLIHNLFNDEKKVITADDGTDSVYDAVKYLCEKMSVPVAGYDKVKAVCEKNVTVENIARVSHFTCRKTAIDKSLLKKESGFFIAFSKDGKKTYACFGKNKKYVAFDPAENKETKINPDFTDTLLPDAYVFYRPFEGDNINLKSMLRFALDGISFKELISFVFMLIVCTLSVAIIPVLNYYLYDVFAVDGSAGGFMKICFGFMIVALLCTIFAFLKNIAFMRITSKIAYDIQNAVYDRFFKLPRTFFEKYDCGDLTLRVTGIGTFVSSLTGLVIMSFSDFVCMILCFVLMMNYSKVLCLAVVMLLFVYAVITLCISLRNISLQKRVCEYEGKSFSVIHQMISGISQIRISAIEDRGVYEYLKPYVRFTESRMASQKVNYIKNAVSVFFMFLITGAVYFCAVNYDNGMSGGELMAFIAVSGVFCMTVTAFAERLSRGFGLKSEYDRIKDIIMTSPETDSSKEIAGTITGDIEVNNVSFSYDDSIENVINDVDLHIHPGEYIGIVGPSGCGKSTLIKLLLGFEKAKNGKIYYDNKDIDRLDIRELRKKAAIVLQNGKLISGSIYENITVMSDNVTDSDVMRAISMVGLNEDLKEFPMGLHTIVSEDAKNISGGQKQRILIARAILGSPSILFFDEATSALDNISQRKVCMALEAMNITRIVVAHRLSTVRNCDRIIVMNEGQIVECGSYDELIDADGLFSEMVKRQIF